MRTTNAALATLLVAASLMGCNGTTTTTSPVTTSKACIDELRRVQIVDPTEEKLGTIDSAQPLLVAWETQHVCDRYEAIVQVSYDGGGHFEKAGWGINLTSQTLEIPERALVRTGCGSKDLRLGGTVIRVTLRGPTWSISDEVYSPAVVLVVCPDPKDPPKPPVTRD